MRKVGQCSKCGSTAIIQRAMIADFSNQGERDLQIRVDRDPSAIILKKSVRSSVHAFVCSSCGFVEMYADNPHDLYEAFVAAEAKSSGSLE